MLLLSNTEYEYMLWFIVTFGTINVPVLLLISAPYGRHIRSGWGPLIPAKLGWIVMEAPSPVCYAIVFSRHYRTGSGVVPFVALGCWQVHYLYRSFIFPILMRGSKKMPLLTVVLAVMFNVANGSINAYGVTELGGHLTSAWLSEPRFVIGLLLFLLGWAINQHSDHILRHLRKPGETGYKIPYGGIYRYVSSPNYLGEIIEWSGYAVAFSVLPAAAFVFFTCSNLVPRAISHHQWYREKFEDYPVQRKAIIPFLW